MLTTRRGPWWEECVGSGGLGSLELGEIDGEGKRERCWRTVGDVEVECSSEWRSWLWLWSCS